MTRTYPGMLDRSKEYFNTDDAVMLLHDGVVKKFEDVEKHPELEQILHDEQELNELLTKWFGKNKKMKLRTLARCRFGALNFTADFCEAGNTSNDHCECIYRGKCEGENIICKPAQINGQKFTEEEIKILKEITTNEKNVAIASNLDIPIGTLNVLKTKLYQKFGFITKQQVSKRLFLEGLL